MSLSLSDLNARAAADTAVEFEYVTAAGEPSGVFLSVLGAQSDKVTGEVNRLLNARRQKEAVQESTRMGGRSQATFTPIEDDIAFGQRLAALRLVGWRGIKEPFSPENALLLCQTNADVADQVIKVSSDAGRFMKASPKA